MAVNTIYCVDVEYPGGRCWPAGQMSMTGGVESDMRVTNRLSTIGNLPTGRLLLDGVGTHIWIKDSNTFEFDGSFETNKCPQNFSIAEDYGGHTQCIKLYYLK